MSPFSILQITDMHIMADLNETFQGINTAHYFKAILDLAFIENKHFDLILVTGDLAQNPCEASYKHILHRLEATQTPSICLPGNHDDVDLMQQVFNTRLVNCDKQTLLNNWQLICLNSQILGKPGGNLSKQELLFLEDCLLKNPNHHTLIAVHHHCLETKSAWMDTMIIENNEVLLSLIKKHPQVKAITWGHIHQEMDVSIDSLRFLGTPSTCFQFTPHSKTFSLDSKSPGYRTINLYPDGLIQTATTRLDEPLFGMQIKTEGY